MDCLELLEGDVDTGYSTTQTQSITKSRMRSVADELELPPIPRDSNMFSGLRNQGATCYLNSLFQAFFMCPEIRQFFYELDLEASGYETDSDRYKILKQFQLLVGKLRFLEFKNHSTIDLTEAFGWNSGEGGEQQDVAEAMRIIFDTLERCFEPSGLADKFSKTFK